MLVYNPALHLIRFFYRSEEEVETVLDSLDTDEEEKEDILKKCREIKKSSD